MKRILIDLFEQHGSLTGIAKELGVTQGTVSLWLIKVGLRLEPRTQLVDADRRERNQQS
jgi:hypothetical protein